MFSSNHLDADGDEHLLRGNPVSLYITNIPAIMGGRAKLWNGQKAIFSKVGIKEQDGRKVGKEYF